jgi:hypothetical protein
VPQVPGFYKVGLLQFLDSKTYERCKFFCQRYKVEKSGTTGTDILTKRNRTRNIESASGTGSGTEAALSGTEAALSGTEAALSGTENIFNFSGKNSEGRRLENEI